jgi:predicted nuclease of restriction endonuclease-like RecB superfamily
MLTGKLVRVKHAKNKLVPLYVPATDEGLLALAEQILLAYRNAVGRTRGEIDEDLHDFTPEGPRGLLPAGLAKLCEDRCEFEVAADHPPDALREAVFKAAATARSEAAKTKKPFNRAAVMTSVAEELSLTLTAEQIDRSLFADLKDEQRVIEFDDVTAEHLLHRYNVALAQAILLRCTLMEVRVYAETPARFRQLFRAVKFHRLICTIQETPGNSYKLTLDGPLSLFSSTNKYGLQLALFLPTLLHCKAFDLRANIRWGAERKEKVFQLSGLDGLKSHAPDFGVYTPPELQMFADTFGTKVKGWILDTDPHPILLATGVWVPDFKLTHAKSGKEVFVEVFGFWRKGDIETHYKNLAKGAPGKFVLCVSEQMRADEADEVTFGNGVYRYKRTPLPEEVARMAELVAGIRSP